MSTHSHMARHSLDPPKHPIPGCEWLKLPIQWQSQLGWAQLYQGQIATHWARAVDIMHPELLMNRMHVMATIQTTVWKYVLATWKLQNEHLHHNADQMDLPNYHQAVITLYKQ